MSNLIAKVVTFILSTIIGVLSLFLLPLGLIVPPFILIPLLLGIIALLSSLGASWVSAPLISNKSYSRLFPVVGIAEATATGLAIVLLVWLKLISRLSLPVSILFGVVTLIIVLSANVATWRYRSVERALAKDILLTAGMVVLGTLISVGVYFLSELFGLIGP